MFSTAHPEQVSEAMQLFSSIQRHYNFLKLLRWISFNIHMYHSGRGHLVDSKQSRGLFLVQTANTILLPHLIPCPSISAEDTREHGLRKWILFGVKSL